MATLSVLNYNNLTVGLNIKMSSNDNQSSAIINCPVQATGNTLSKTFNKITVQNVLSESHGNSLNITNANPNAIVRKIKDFGMIGSVNNAAGAASLNMNSRKRPLVESKQNQKPLDCKTALIITNKKPKLTKEERVALRLAKKQAKENASNSLKITAQQPLALIKTNKVPGTPGRKGLPLPQAVARRNARERNRVKQVNNGFAALRERIPEEVAEVFENQGSNRGSGKKLSKVETLRMAVEYIRSLERLLGFNFPVVGSQHNSSSGEDSFSLIKDDFEAYSPTMDEQFDDSLSHYDNEEFFNASNSNNTALNMMINTSPPQALQQTQIDALPNITTLNGLQYIRIPGTNTYQLLTPDIFVGTAASPPSSTIDEEHFTALIDTNCSSPSLTSSPPTIGIQQTLATSTPSPPSSSSAINAIELTSRVTETAPALTNAITGTTTTITATNGRDINEVNSIQTTAAISSSLSTSPVPENQQQHENMLPLLPSSPSTSSQQLQQQLQTLSPALANDQLQQGLSSTCATNQQQQTEFLLQNAIDRQQQQQQQIGSLHMIKQEYDEPSVLYQQQQPQQQQLQQQQLQQLFHSAMSPPIDRNTPSTSTSSSNQILPSFFPSEQNAASFYEGVVTLKKEFDDVILDASHGTDVLSDESMIEAIDWWDAHTPKSENGSLMM